jgi:hypothetical protein
MLLFSVDPEIGHESQLEPIRTGLANWKSVWHQRSVNNDECFFDILVTGWYKNGSTETILPNDEPSMWRRPGFWRYAPEFWLLAQLYLERMQFASQKAIENGEARLSSECDDGEMIQLKRFIEKFQSSEL